ncbi:L,D-transpeptidase family protein [Streptomyces europaeiscabiei]|uniref:L,D-transpeptidase family protein n=1 Tax=Streptomyces europaeiscabiei TaxID=146819 RepID=UPI002E29A0D5|nr:L,D-transpeptidase family protein [Streptomyces europaeiscabiei]
MNTGTAHAVRRRLRAIATAGVAAVAVSLLPSAAGAQEPGAAAGAPDAPRAAEGTSAEAAAAKGSTYLEFKKNKKDPSNSRLSFYFVQQVDSDKTRTWRVASWRAGSGLGTADNKVGRDGCKSNVGWLPSGTYNITNFSSNFSGKINGIVWRLSNKKCTGKAKTERTALFIHSEMKSNGKQGSTEATRWDGNSDYKSNGCVKLKPADVRELKSYRSSYPKPTRLYVS